jgi:membrane associated rhomboid family serine protease
VIPVRDVIPSGTTPVATIALIAANTLAFSFGPPLPWEDIRRSMFTHGDWLHFLGTMLYLWIFGDNVEASAGHFRFLLLYLLCGTAAALGQVALEPGAVSHLTGASGAVTGILAAYFVLYPRSRVLVLAPFLTITHLAEVSAAFFLGIWFALQILPDFGSPGLVPEAGRAAAFLAHASAFVTGAVAIRVLKRRRKVVWWD